MKRILPDILFCTILIKVSNSTRYKYILSVNIQIVIDSETYFVDTTEHKVAIVINSLCKKNNCFNNIRSIFSLRAYDLVDSYVCLIYIIV